MTQFEIGHFGGKRFSCQPFGNDFDKPLLRTGCEMSVLAAAGATALTRMPVSASSLPNDLVRPITPAFAAE